MRAGFVYIALVMISLEVLFALPGSGQELDKINVTVELHGESVNNLFSQIQRQTNLLFAFQQSQVGDLRITMPKGNRTVRETLDLAFAGTLLSYRAVNNSVIVFQVEPIPVQGGDLHYVSGTVSDKSGAGLPGVNVIIRGTAEGTVTDAQGKYTLQVNESDILLFSFIGFKRFETEAGERTVIDVSLEEDNESLKEVVISGGYYETTDELKTGSIIKVTSKDIEKQPVTNPLMALQGRVPGLEVTPSTGAPGVAPKIRIRGTNSLRTDGNFPLYIVDGVPISATPLESFTPSFTNQGFDPLSTINPANIESIEVLKDGDATAMYGSRGANGVIIITTKRSTKTIERTNVDIMAYTGVGKVSKQMDLLGLKDYLSMRKEALRNAGSTPQQANAYDLYLWDTTRSTNWQKALLDGSATITDVQAGISSGTKNTSFRFNGGYHKETLIFPGDFGYNRLSGQLSVNHVSSDQKFHLSVTSMYGVDNSHFFVGDVMGAALTLPPDAPNPYNDDGSLNWEIHNIGGIPTSTWTNPFSTFKMTQDVRTSSIISNINLAYEVLPGLSVSVQGGQTDLDNSETSKNPKAAFSPTSTFSGTATFGTNHRRSWIAEPKISFGKQIDRHRIDVVTGATVQSTFSSRDAFTGQQYTSDALLGSLIGAGVVQVVQNDKIDYRYSSLYARLGYKWDEKYILNLTGRRDGSSRFGPGKRFGNFGSVGAAWIFSKERLVAQAVPFIYFGKLRGSYGLTGSDNIGDYNYYNLYTISSTKYGGLSGISPLAVYNPNYAWEVTKKLEAAVELSFLKGKIGLEVNWYRNRSSNQLVSYPLSEVTGFQSVSKNFDATIENSGWEGILRFDLLNSNSWRWNASINFSAPSNKLVTFDGIEDSPYNTIYKVGEPLSIQYLYTWTGVNPQTGIHSFVDVNGDGILNDLDKTLQNLTGTVYYGGINNTVQFKNVEISFLFQFSHRQTPPYIPATMPGDLSNQPTTALDRWQNDGDITNVQKYSIPYTPTGLTQASKNYNLLGVSSYNSVDGSFIRLKTLSVSYRFPQRWLSAIALQEGRVFIQGQNLLTITGYSGLDPETGSALPPLRMVTGGIQFKF